MLSNEGKHLPSLVLSVCVYVCVHVTHCMCVPLGFLYASLRSVNFILKAMKSHMAGSYGSEKSLQNFEGTCHKSED